MFMHVTNSCLYVYFINFMSYKHLLYMTPPYIISVFDDILLLSILTFFFCVLLFT